jgi:hypothetical protein
MEKWKFFTLQGVELRLSIVQPVASRCTDCATLRHESCRWFKTFQRRTSELMRTSEVNLNYFLKRNETCYSNGRAKCFCRRYLSQDGKIWSTEQESLHHSTSLIHLVLLECSESAIFIHIQLLVVYMVVPCVSRKNSKILCKYVYFICSIILQVRRKWTRNPALFQWHSFKLPIRVGPQSNWWGEWRLGTRSVCKSLRLRECTNERDRE